MNLRLRRFLQFLERFGHLKWYIFPSNRGNNPQHLKPAVGKPPNCPSLVGGFLNWNTPACTEWYSDKRWFQFAKPNDHYQLGYSIKSLLFFHLSVHFVDLWTSEGIVVSAAYQTCILSKAVRFEQNKYIYFGHFCWDRSVKRWSKTFSNNCVFLNRNVGLKSSPPQVDICQNFNVNLYDLGELTFSWMN